MGKVEGENKMEPQVTLWHKGWKAGPISCAIPKLHEPTPPLTKTTVDSARYRWSEVVSEMGGVKRPSKQSDPLSHSVISLQYLPSIGVSL